MRYHKIPDETIRRLPIYLRALLLFCEQGQENISSKLLAEFSGFNPAQIRKDFSYFGGFGTRGVGYKTDDLIKNIKKILKLNVTRKAALIGVGNLGSAILQYGGFDVYGFDIQAAFDSSESKIGKVINGVKIEDVSKLCDLEKEDIGIAILSVPGLWHRMLLMCLLMLVFAVFLTLRLQGWWCLVKSRLLQLILRCILQDCPTICMDDSEISEQ